ncbi:MAG: prephenate dehydratase [Rikenellaceae bacterium]
MKIAIQGVAGCYHEAAARSYFSHSDVEMVNCESFDHQFEKMSKDNSLLGVVAIENTIAGSLLQNHELIRSSNLRIIGEQKIRISHVVAALAGQSIEDIGEVSSHPIALMQCRDWLKKHPWLKVVEYSDTASSAMNIAEGQLRGHAAICGELAAQLYGLNILQRGVETNKHNFTRFLVVANEGVAESFTSSHKAVNKASLCFSLAHSQGALSKVLTILSFYDVNLTKIQSLPIIGREWEYLFYVDVIFDNYTKYRQSIDAARPLTNEFKILGEYAECENPNV